jgi:hypothetical protein
MAASPVLRATMQNRTVQIIIPRNMKIFSWQAGTDIMQKISNEPGQTSEHVKLAAYSSPSEVKDATPPLCWT